MDVASDMKRTFAIVRRSSPSLCVALTVVISSSMVSYSCRGHICELEDLHVNFRWATRVVVDSVPELLRFGGRG